MSTTGSRSPARRRPGWARARRRRRRAPALRRPPCPRTARRRAGPPGPPATGPPSRSRTRRRPRHPGGRRRRRGGRAPARGAGTGRCGHAGSASPGPPPAMTSVGAGRPSAGRSPSTLSQASSRRPRFFCGASRETESTIEPSIARSASTSARERDGAGRPGADTSHTRASRAPSATATARRSADAPSVSRLPCATSPAIPRPAIRLAAGSSGGRLCHVVTRRARARRRRSVTARLPAWKPCACTMSAPSRSPRCRHHRRSTATIRTPRSARALMSRRARVLVGAQIASWSDPLAPVGSASTSAPVSEATCVPIPPVLSPSTMTIFTSRPLVSSVAPCPSVFVHAERRPAAAGRRAGRQRRR